MVAPGAGSVVRPCSGRGERGRRLAPPQAVRLLHLAKASNASGRAARRTSGCDGSASEGVRWRRECRLRHTVTGAGPWVRPKGAALSPITGQFLFTAREQS